MFNGRFAENLQAKRVRLIRLLGERSCDLPSFTRLNFIHVRFSAGATISIDPLHQVSVVS